MIFHYLQLNNTSIWLQQEQAILFQWYLHTVVFPCPHTVLAPTCAAVPGQLVLITPVPGTSVPVQSFFLDPTTQHVDLLPLQLCRYNLSLAVLVGLPNPEKMGLVISWSWSEILVIVGVLLCFFFSVYTQSSGGEGCPLTRWLQSICNWLRHSEIVKTLGKVSIQGY